MKKILSLLMIFALMMSVFVGCGPKTGVEQTEDMTSKEVFDKAQEVSQDMTNTSFLADFDLEMTGMEASGIAGPMGLKMTGDIKDTQNMKLSLEVEAQGMTVNGDIYMKEKEMLIYFPLLQGMLGKAYIKANLDTITEQAGTPVAQPDPQKIKDILKRFEEQTEYSIYDIVKLSEEKEIVEVVVNEETQKATKLTANIVLDGADDMLFSFIKFMYTDEEAKAVFFANMTDEELADMQAQMEDEATRAEIKAALEALNINEFSVAMYLDGEFRSIKTEMVMDMSMQDPNSDETISIKLTGYMDYFNIGGVEEIVLPEVDPSEIMDLDEMM